MLGNLRDFPRDFLNYYFASYSSGIIAGVDLAVDEDFLHIGKGIIKFNGMLYLLSKPLKIDYSNNDQATIIKVRFEPVKEKEDFEIHDSEVILDDELKVKENEFELGRFKLREGAQLKNDYDKFEDFDVEYNTLNLINVLYSTPGGASLHPKIIQKFAKVLYVNSKEMIDNVFAAECLNSRVVSKKLVENYLKKRLDTADDNYSNREIYNHLNQILSTLSIVRKPQKEKQHQAQQIIVD